MLLGKLRNINLELHLDLPQILQYLKDKMNMFAKLHIGTFLEEKDLYFYEIIILCGTPVN